MKSKFHCKDCDLIFEAEAKKNEFIDPVFGPCTNYFANCPKCNNECKEYYKPKPRKTSKKDNLPPCGNPNMSCCRQ